MNEVITELALDPRALRRLRKDLQEAPLTPNEARYLVDTYYAWQDVRKRSANQMRSLDSEPGYTLRWLIEQSESVESIIKSVLHTYSQRSPIGRWAETMHGVGPIISAGLLAHIDMHRAPTVGHIWSFGGWNPTVKWQKGQKRPWNASLKVLFWKCGDSFVKTSNSPKSLYGQFYREAKTRFEAANERRDYQDVAHATLKEVPNHRDKAIYADGKLPPGRIDLRARRVAVKIFLSHWHEVAYWVTFNRPAPAPYPMEHLGHVHKIPVPNTEMIEGFPG